MVTALRGGSGKTMISIGLIAALRADGLRVAPFKKGPDYIDAGWLSLAAGKPCYNLDSFLIPREIILQQFHTHAGERDLALIEGNRGLYDCIDTHGETSTAELAKLLALPVLLILDSTKTTRTMAAVVSGCSLFDPAVRIRGVILNRVAGTRHESILRRSIEEHCGIPVLGAIPKLRRQPFPERHMGLVPTPEHDWAREAIQEAATMVRDYLDLERIQDVAAEVPRLENDPPHGVPIISDRLASSTQPTVAVMQDAAFQFYYPENLEALERAGARLIMVSPLRMARLPDIDGLYIGGGFPETHAAQLAANETFRAQLRALADAGLPIYAECGGLMYLGQKLVLAEGSFDMAGVLPVSFGFNRRPQGHGYTLVEVAGENPYFRKGTGLKGHEFHYSSVLEWTGRQTDLVFRMERGTGLVEGRDGLCYKNVLATYTHIHALGTPEWAPALIDRARLYRSQKKEGGQGA